MSTRLVLSACLVVACAAPREEPPALQRLLPDGSRALLGRESRPASGPRPVGVFRGEIDRAGPGAVSVALPAAAASQPYVVLRAVERPVAEPAPFQGPAPRRVSVRVAQVDTSGPEPRVRLHLGAPPGDGPSRVWVEALPLAARERETLRFPVALPTGARLAFGYGLREESWRAEGDSASFRVELVGAGGDRHALFEATLDPHDPDQRRWFDAEVDLARWGGERVTLELTTRRHGGLAALSLPVWGDPSVYGPTPADAPPDVILISLDTLRARSLGIFGYARDTSPFFDELAAQGTLFTRAITSAVSTSPSHMSLFTGLYPVRHGVLAGVGGRAPGVTGLAEILRGAGYTTAAFTEDGYVDPARFAPGFGRFTENAADSRETPGFAHLTFSQAREWLASRPQRPFLLFVHTYEVHAPYDPPESTAAIFAGDGLEGPDHPILRRYRDDYDREIRGLDAELRSFFEALGAEGLDSRTLVVVSADHGEEFGEHGRFQHGGAVFDETLHVPLLFWGPGRVPAGARRSEAVSLIDVLPTLLELVGLPVPPDLDGTSLAAAIRDGTPIPSRTLFAEARTNRDWLREFETQRWQTPLFAVVSEGRKFVVQRPAGGARPPVLRYDLAGDPQERDPVTLDAAQAAEVNRVLDAYLAAGVPSEARDDPDSLRPELEERLRALGYLE